MSLGEIGKEEGEEVLPGTIDGNGSGFLKIDSFSMLLLEANLDYVAHSILSSEKEKNKKGEACFFLGQGIGSFRYNIFGLQTLQ